MADSHAPPVLRISCVEYLNSKTLIYGLADQADLDLQLRVPSALLETLRNRSADVSLLPVIDYQRLRGLVLIPSGGIGCRGKTLTVRLFSRVPIKDTRVLACDTDSHTSVALARVLLKRLYGLSPRVIERHQGTGEPGETTLLIGDKVISEGPTDMPYQLDLGEAWHDLTGLPFVFAAWFAREGVTLRDLPARLMAARIAGLEAVDEIVAEHAPSRSWPIDIARAYLTEYLKFDIGPDQLTAIRLFHSFAAEDGLIPTPARPLKVLFR